MDDTNKKRIDDYFSFLAERFPVMCACDEFHFLPRSDAASRRYGEIDNLDRDVIEDTVQVLKTFLGHFRKQIEKAKELEEKSDWQSLAANASGVLIELERSRSWRYNPIQYLKIAFIGLDHALNRPASGEQARLERIGSRMDGIPILFVTAAKNIETIPESYHTAALSMIEDCRKYLLEISTRDPIFNSLMLEDSNRKILGALDKFRQFLTRTEPLPDAAFSFESLEPTLKDHFCSSRKPDEIFDLSGELWEAHLRELDEIAKQIDPGASWRRILDAYTPPIDHSIDTFTLYRNEITKLDRFFSKNGFIDTADTPELAQTPTYLNSVRSSASFAAALTADPGEISYFYLTAPKTAARGAANLDLEKRLHKEYQFLTAHESIPGHHLLDNCRRRLENPVRRQIESPLFYEGWATYAESLLFEHGYADRPIDRLIQAKRNLWRAARCRIDVGRYLGKLSRSDAIDLVVKAGFSPVEAAIQTDRFQLNPGYQLCYLLGCFEFERLRKMFVRSPSTYSSEALDPGAGKLPEEQFHSFLLNGGELPFHLVEKRLRAKTSKI
jgi:hypothetical protein